MMNKNELIARIGIAMVQSGKRYGSWADSAKQARIFAESIIDEYEYPIKPTPYCSKCGMPKQKKMFRRRRGSGVNEPPNGVPPDIDMRQ